MLETILVEARKAEASVEDCEDEDDLHESSDRNAGDFDASDGERVPRGIDVCRKDCDEHEDESDGGKGGGFLPEKADSSGDLGKAGQRD